MIVSDNLLIPLCFFLQRYLTAGQVWLLPRPGTYRAVASWILVFVCLFTTRLPEAHPPVVVFYKKGCMGVKVLSLGG